MNPDPSTLQSLAIPIAGIFGLFIGSFLNVVVYRAPLGLSVNAPRSFCPTCRRQLLWWENLPVVSWLALRGRCRTCRVRIPIRYPMVELATAVTFSLVTWGWHGHFTSVPYCVLAAATIAVGLIEYGGERAPLSVAAIGTGAALLLIVGGDSWQGHWRMVLGSAVGAAVGLVVVAVLRRTDPDCTDSRGHGRSTLLMAGAWVGGLGTRAAVVGGCAWIAAYLVVMAGAWAVSHRRSSGPGRAGVERHIPPVLAVPLVTAIAVGMAASLIALG